jgi:hypothetical protein
MQKHTVSGGSLMLGSGAIALLTAAQLSARRHNVEVISETKIGAKVRVINPLTFKDGEEIEVDQVPKGTAGVELQIETAKEKKPSKALLARAHQAGRDEALSEVEASTRDLIEDARKAAHSAGRAEALSEVRAQNDVLDALDEAQAAFDAADEAGKADAQAVLTAAQAAAAALKPLEA